MAKPRARARDEMPTRLELVHMALDLHDLALEATRESNGNVWVSPELGSAAKALELTARLAGHLGDGKNWTLDQLKSELDRMGWKLVPKKELKSA